MGRADRDGEEVEVDEDKEAAEDGAEADEQAHDDKDVTDPNNLQVAILSADARRVRLRLGDEPLQRRKPLSSRALAALPAPPVAMLVEKAKPNSHFVERPMEPAPMTGRGMHILQFVKPAVTKTVQPPAEEKESGDGQWEEEEEEDWNEESSTQQWSNNNNNNNTNNGNNNTSSSNNDWGQWSDPTTSYPSSKSHDGYSSQHGSYRHYYGYRRNGGGAAAKLGELDSRLISVAEKLGKRCFDGMKVLDIGCNSGEISLAVARHLGARRVVGCDIDSKLVEDAIANRDSFVKSLSSDQDAEAPENTKHVPKRGKAGGTCSVTFKNQDFLEAPEEKDGGEKQELYDAILCFSVTKWIHFTHGDKGIRKLFRRVFRKLNPGGLFVLEPQEWRSYKKKRHLTPQIRKTVAGIQLHPGQFDSFLKELGFEAVAVIEPPADAVEGFKRFIRVYKKPAEEEEIEEAEKELEKAPPEEPPIQNKKKKKAEGAKAKEEDAKAEAKLEDAKAKKKAEKKQKVVEAEELEDKPAPTRKKAQAAAASAAVAAKEPEVEGDGEVEPEHLVKKKKRRCSEMGSNKKVEKKKKKAPAEEQHEEVKEDDGDEDGPPTKRKKGPKKKQKAAHNA